MAVYCAYFRPSSSWISDPGEFWQMQSVSDQCDQGWVVIQTPEFNALVSASQSTAPVSSSVQFTADEVAALKLQASAPSPFNLSIQDGATIAVSVLGCWAVAFAFKTVANAFSGPSSME